jgi:regulator of sigma E protease
MLTIIAWIVVFGVLVAVHEFGHYLVAKSMGMAVEEYSLGFGPSLVSRRWGETRYSLRVVPLGGYVRIRGMDGQNTADPRDYPNRPIWQRFLVIFAGPVMNLLLAMVLFFVALGPVGAPVETTTIQHLIAHYPAQAAGLRAGDRIVAIDGHHIATGSQISQVIGHHAHRVMRVTVARGRRVMTVLVKPRYDKALKEYLIGIELGVKVVHLGLIKALTTGVVQTVQLTGSWFVVLYQLVTGQHAFDLMGPVGIAVTVGQAARAGWYWLITLGAVLSANLGLFNILPVPVLDGSRLFLLGVEGVRRRAMDPERESMIHMVGMAFLLLLVIVVTYHDIVHYLHIG